MGRYHRSLPWAFSQFTNRIFQEISYKFDAGYCKPSRIIFCLTTRCNLKCKHCDFWRTPNREELTTEQWKKIILEVKHWLGPYRIQVAGGEIFFRDDIPALVRFGHDNGVLMGMVSNGTMINDELAKELVKSGLGYFDVSLDGIRPETHDNIRGVDGVYEKVMATIQVLKNHRKKLKSSMSLVVATVIMDSNMDELVEIAKFVEKEGLDGVSFNPLGPPADTDDPQWYKKSEIWPEESQLKKLDEVIDELILLKKNGARILNSDDQFLGMKDYFRNPSKPRGGMCSVGVTNMLVMCDGDVHFCPHISRIGKLGEPFREAWNSENAKIARERIKSCNHICSPGNFIYNRSLIKDIIRYLQYR